MTPQPQPLAFDALAGFADDDALAAFAAFRDWARAIAAETPPLRAAKTPSPRLMQVAQAACGASIADNGAARRFFVDTSARGASSPTPPTAPPSSPAITSPSSTPR